MSGPRRSHRVAAGAAILLAYAAVAVADDAAPPNAAPAAPEPGKPAADKPTFEGEIRVGWRFMSGEGEGRYPQDWGLKDGPRVFDLNLLGTDPRVNAPIDEIEVNLAGIGDPNSDYLIALRKRGLFDLSTGYRRDDYSYRASGDPFPYDTIRERTFVHGLWTPNGDLAVRVAWDRYSRDGDAYLQTYDGFTGQSRGQHRELWTESDRFTVGADYAIDVFRFGVTETVVLSDLDDERRSASPTDQSADHADVSARAESYATTLKAGVSLLGGDLDATVFVTRSYTPVEERMNETTTDDTGATQPSSSVGKLERRALDCRFETSWRPAKGWEVVIAGERDDIVDDERATYVDTGAQPTAQPDETHITDRSQRWSADVIWDASDAWRLRVGEQYLRQELYVPTDTHFAVPPTDRRYRPTDFSSNSLRTTMGADWKASKKLTISALTHLTSNDEPQTTPTPDQTNDYSLRVRWKPSDELAFTTVGKRSSLAQNGAVRLYDIGHAPDPALGEHPGESTSLDSATRATSISQSAAYTHGPWTVTGTATYRRFDTSSDTAWTYFDAGASAQALRFETESFKGTDVTANLDVRYAITKTLRVFGTTTRTSSHGDYTALWTDVSVGGEYDLRKDVTLGLTVSTWRLNEKHGGVDDYDTYAAEMSVTYRF